MKIFVQWNLTQEMNFESDGRAKKKEKNGSLQRSISPFMWRYITKPESHFWSWNDWNIREWIKVPNQPQGREVSNFSSFMLVFLD